jgi:hypothetical protein
MKCSYCGAEYEGNFCPELRSKGGITVTCDATSNSATYR